MPTKQRPAAVAMLRTTFAQDSAEAAHTQWRQVADALRERFPRLAERMDGAREDVLAYMTFPREHWPQIASTNPLERLNGEIKRRADVVGIFPTDRAVVRLVGPDARAERRVGGQPSLHEPGVARSHER
jgi:putative transposase